MVSTGDLRTCKYAMLYAGVGKEMADYDHRSCLPSGASKSGPWFTIVQQESKHNRLWGMGGGGRGGGGRGRGGGEGVFSEDSEGAWI
jgi:hypothetical protein